MIDRGIIRRSSSPFGSPIVIVRKKDNSIRLCIDYRKVNARTLLDAFPLPRIEEALEVLANTQLYTSLDPAHGYFQIAMDPESIPITAFRVPWGLFEFTRMPQGLKNSPATFQRVMELIFGDLNYSSLILYLDDVLVFSQDFEQHVERLETVLKRLIQNGLKLNGKKCNLFQEKLLYLGHIVSKNGIEADPNKIQKFENWPIPQTVEDLRSFIGLASYYRRYIKNFAVIVAPLHKLVTLTLKKAGKPPSSLDWSEESNMSFEVLKALLVHAPVLAYPNFKEPFIVEVDASLRGLGACLSQYNQKGELHPIAFASRGLRGSEKNYSDYSSFKLELLAMKWAVSEKFREYLLASHVIVYTDNNPLSYLSTAKLGATEQHWVAQLAPFDLEIRYRSGKSNKCADALSRCPTNMSCLESENIIQEILDCTILKTEIKNHFRVEQNSFPEIYVLNNDHSTGGILPSFSLEELTKFQKDDPQLQEIWHLKSSGWEQGQDLRENQVEGLSGWLREYSKIIFQHNILYREVPDSVSGTIKQFFIPKCLREVVLKAAHDHWGHQGVYKTYMVLRSRCFWPGMAADIKKHIKVCFHCTVSKPPTPSLRTPMRHLTAFKPLEVLAVDFLKLDKGRGGHEDVLIMTGGFTSLAQAVA